MGLLTLLSRFTAWTFLVFGLAASLPFFVFNAWFVFVAEMFTALMLLDFAGNVIFLAIGILGWRAMRMESEPVWSSLMSTRQRRSGRRRSERPDP